MSAHSKKAVSARSRSLSRSRSTSSSESHESRLNAEPQPQVAAGSLMTRLRSLSNPGTDQVDQVHSGRHIDDQSVYHSDRSSDEISSKGADKPDTIQEVRNGILNERDLDLEKSQHPELTELRKSKSNRSSHDPKLVSSDEPLSFELYINLDR